MSKRIQLAPGVKLRDESGSVIVKLEAKIGHGGCGEAWRAKHRRGVCVVKTSHLDDSQSMQHEKKVMELLGTKARSNILYALESFRGEDGRHYLVTEYCEHGDFRKNIQRRMEQREDKCERYACDTLASLLLFYVGGYCKNFKSVGQQVLEELNAVIDAPAFAPILSDDVMKEICTFVDAPDVPTGERLLKALHRRAPFVVYERCSDLSMAEVEADYWCIARQLLCALHCAHEEGVMHRDMKWENVFLARGNALVLGDFGVSSLLDVGVTCARLVDGGELPMGTTAYLPPEALDGRFGPPGDIWALGIMLHELCLARHPFLPNGTARRLLPPQIFQRVTAAEGLYRMAKLHDLGLIQGLSRQLCEFVDSMLHVDSRRRPSAGALLRNAVFGEQLLCDWEAVLQDVAQSKGTSEEKSTALLCRERLRNITRDLQNYHKVVCTDDPYNPSTLARVKVELQRRTQKKASSNPGNKLKRAGDGRPPLPSGGPVGLTLG